MAENDLAALAGEVRAECLCMALRQAARAVTQQYEATVSGSGVRATQFSLLVALAQAPLVPLSRLAEALVMDRTTLTRNLAPLLRDGLVEERAGGDRRVRAFALTGEGKKTLSRALPGWKRAQSQTLRALSRADAATLRRLLGTLVAATQP